MPIPLRPRPRPPVLADTTDPAEALAVCSLSAAAFGVAQDRARAAPVICASPQGIQWPYDAKYGGQRYEPDAKGPSTGTPPA